MKSDKKTKADNTTTVARKILSRENTIECTGLQTQGGYVYVLHIKPLFLLVDRQGRRTAEKNENHTQPA